MDKTCKYYQYQRYVSYDNGQTWHPMGEYQRGELMEFNSPDCGAGIDTMYKWVVVEGEFSCEGYDKYELTQKYISHDGGNTWSPMSGEYSIGSLIEHNSEDCGYFIYDKWRWVDTEDFICIEEEDCDADYINGLPTEIGSIRDSGASISYGYITASDVKGEEYSASTEDSPTKDLLVNTSFMIRDKNGFAPMTYMTHLSALTVTNKAKTNSNFPPYDSAYNGIVGVYGCNISYPHLFGMINILFSDNIINLGCKGRPNDSLCELSYSYVKQEKLIEYRGNFTSSNFLIFPMSDIMKYFNLWFMPKYKYLANGYWCDGSTKKETGDIYMSLSGTSYTKITTISSNTVIEVDSPDCISYRWHAVPITEEYICSGDSMYYKEYYQVSYDNGQTWSNVIPTSSRTGVMYSECAALCGCGEAMFEAHYSDSSSYSVECGFSGDVITTAITKSYKPISAMTDCIIGNCATAINGNAFSNAYNLSACTIGNGVTSIGYRAFYACNALTSITIPDSVTSIGSSVFYSCTSLSSATIPNTITSIGNEFFYNCNSLTRLNSDIDGVFNIPSGVTSIGNYAFQYCTSLTSITLPSGVTSIGEGAFYYCSGMTSCSIGSGVTSISRSTFYNCRSLTSIDIPDSVTSIGYQAFLGCYNLSACTIGNGVTSIGNYAFQDCSGMTSCTIGSGVTSIGDSAFKYCTSLASIDIPDSVTTISSNAFQYCRGLTSVTVNAITPPTLGNNYVFDNAPIASIYVPAESVESYKTASGWSRYADIIIGI